MPLEIKSDRFLDVTDVRITKFDFQPLLFTHPPSETTIYK